jgi:hypothetical protein
MLHEYRKAGHAKMPGNRIPETTEIAVMAKLPAVYQVRELKSLLIVFACHVLVPVVLGLRR